MELAFFADAEVIGHACFPVDEGMSCLAGVQNDSVVDDREGVTGVVEMISCQADQGVRFADFSYPTVKMASILLLPLFEEEEGVHIFHVKSVEQKSEKDVCPLVEAFLYFAQAGECLQGVPVGVEQFAADVLQGGGLECPPVDEAYGGEVSAEVPDKAIEASVAVVYFANIAETSNS